MAAPKLAYSDYSVNEVAKERYVNLGRSAIYYRIAAGEIDAFTDRYGHLRISAREIERLQAEQKKWEELDPDAWEAWKRRHESARSAAYANVAKYGREAVGHRAFNGKIAFYEHKVDPDERLSPSERRDRALAEQRAEMATRRGQRAAKRSRAKLAMTGETR